MAETSLFWSRIVNSLKLMKGLADRLFMKNFKMFILFGIITGFIWMPDGILSYTLNYNNPDDSNQIKDFSSRELSLPSSENNSSQSQKESNGKSIEFFDPDSSRFIDSETGKVLDKVKTTLKFNDAPLEEVLETFSQLTDMNIFIDEAVSKKKITIFVKDLSLRQTLDLILQSNDLSQKKINSKTIIVYPDRKEAKYKEKSEFRVFKLNNMAPKDAAAIVKSVDKDITLQMDDKQDVLVVFATRAVLDRVSKLIEKIDTVQVQVVISLEILEVDRGELKKIGLEFNNQGGILLPSDFQGYDKNNFPLQAVLQKECSKTRVLARPQIMIMNKETGTIKIGDRIPVEIINSSTDPSTGTSVNLQKSIQWVDIGIRLSASVLKVHNDKEVTVKFEAEASSQIGETADGVPEIRTRNVDSIIRLEDGKNVVLGGLINENVTESIAKIPILSDIPGLGKLFRRKKYDLSSSEILIFISPRIKGSIDTGVSDLYNVQRGKVFGEDYDRILLEELPYQKPDELSESRQYLEKLKDSLR